MSEQRSLERIERKINRMAHMTIAIAVAVFLLTGNALLGFLHLPLPAWLGLSGLCLPALVLAFWIRRPFRP